MTGKQIRHPGVIDRKRHGRFGRCKPHRKLRFWVIFIGILGGLIAILLTVDAAFRPVIQEFARVQAKFLAVVTINDAIDKSMTQKPCTYSDLVATSRDDAGNITSLTLNPEQVNTVSSQLALAANDALAKLPMQEVSVPVGTVLGLQILAGRGPALHFRIQPASFTECSIISTLESAGINQTLHKVLLRFNVNVETFVAGYHISQTVTNDVVLTQTVIVGDVPNIYYND